MSKYTTELRYLVEAQFPLFDYYYPIWDEAYRGVLEQKIMDRYRFREIGFETAAQFKHFLKMRLNTIMPTYVELYNAKVQYLLQDAYVNKNITTHQKRDVSENSRNDTKADTLQNITGTTTTDHDGLLKVSGSENVSGSTQQSQTSSETHSNTIVLDRDATENRRQDNDTTTSQTTTNNNTQVFQDTPTTHLDAGADYATNKTLNNNSETVTGTTGVDVVESGSSTEDSRTNDTGTTTGTLTNGVTNKEDSLTNQTTTVDNKDQTNVTENTTNNLTQQATTVATTTDEYLETIKGFDGMKYAFEVFDGVRSQIINIDNMILDDLENLFMGVW